MGGEDKELAGPKFHSKGAIYTPEDLDAVMNEAAARAAEQAADKAAEKAAIKFQSQYQPPQYQPPPPQDQPKGKRRRREDDDDDEEDLVGINPKFVKQLQNTVGVFNALKEFSTNPLQQAIEKRVGDVAATVIESAFSPRGPPPKKDLVDTFLNSQFAYGLGAGLGQRAPELVETLSKSFGKAKTEEMIDTMIGKYGKGGTRQLSEGNSTTSGGVGSGEEPKESSKSPEQSNIELLLSLDPNNPEHVAAYAESQGGINIDTARKMLMIHQDDIIKKMKPQGGYSQETHSQPHPSQVQTQTPPQARQYDTPVQHTEPIQTPPKVQQYDTSVQSQPQYQTSSAVPVQTYQQEQEQQEQKQQEQTLGHDQNTQHVPTHNVQYPEQDNTPGIQYTEFQDASRANNTQNNNEQLEIMKTFADEIGKVMEGMIGKIETLGGTVQSLERELTEIKRSKVPTTVSPPIAPPITPQMTQPVYPMAPIRNDVVEPSIATISLPMEQDILDRLPIDIQSPIAQQPFGDIDSININDLLQQHPPQQFAKSHLDDLSSTEEFFEKDLSIVTKQELLKELETESKIGNANKIAEKLKTESKEIKTDIEQKIEDVQRDTIEQQKTGIKEPKEDIISDNIPNIQEDKIEEHKDKEPKAENIQVEKRPKTVKDRIKESKNINKFVTPIRKDDVYKKFTPLVKKSENQE